MWHMRNCCISIYIFIYSSKYIHLYSTIQNFIQLTFPNLVQNALQKYYVVSHHGFLQLCDIKKLSYIAINIGPVICTCIQLYICLSNCISQIWIQNALQNYYVVLHHGFLQLCGIREIVLYRYKYSSRYMHLYPIVQKFVQLYFSNLDLECISKILCDVTSWFLEFMLHQRNCRIHI